MSEDVDEETRRTTGTPLPRTVGHAGELLTGLDGQAKGSVWQLDPAARDLDANVIALPAGGSIEGHVGPDLDVLIHVLEGSGTLGTESESVGLDVGSIVWLPKRSWRRFEAGSQGLRYFSVHHRKPGLSISMRGEEGEPDQLRR
jgi:quercetin dioxygenase-like cupin family protein